MSNIGQPHAELNKVVAETINILSDAGQLHIDYLDQEGFDSLVNRTVEAILAVRRVSSEGIVVKPQSFESSKALVNLGREALKSVYKPKGRIIQNALRVISTDEILVSRHRHDFVTSRDGNVFVDGGRDYLRQTVPTPDIEDLSVFADSSIQDKVYRLLWGTRGKDGKQKLTSVFLRNCETDHLEAILQNANPGPDYREVINEILAKRRVNPTWGIDYTYQQIVESFV